MSTRAGTAVFLALAALAANAEERPAPLENTRQELNALRQDQTTKSSGAASGKLTEGMPQIDVPMPGAVPLAQPRSESEEMRLKKKRQKEAQKNWLVEGVSALEKSDKERKKDAAGPAEEPLPNKDREQLDSSDPQYILKLYDEQKKEDNAKAGPRKDGGAAGDPLAPFLQGWLGSSPVRGKFFDEFMKKPDTGGLSMGTAESTVAVPVGSSGVMDAGAVPARTMSETLQPNPYLQGLESFSLRDVAGGRSQPPVTFGSLTKPGEAAPVSSPVAAPPPVAGPPGKNPLPAALSEQQKYFPQLKKF